MGDIARIFVYLQDKNVFNFDMPKIFLNSACNNNQSEWLLKKSAPMAAMFFDRSKFHEHFLKRVTQGKIL